MNDIQGVLNLLLSVTEGAKCSSVLGSSWVQEGAGQWAGSFLLPFLGQPVSSFTILGKPSFQPAPASKIQIL